MLKLRTIGSRLLSIMLIVVMLGSMLPGVTIEAGTPLITEVNLTLEIPEVGDEIEEGKPFSVYPAEDGVHYEPRLGKWEYIKDGEEYPTICNRKLESGDIIYASFMVSPKDDYAFAFTGDNKTTLKINDDNVLDVSYGRLEDSENMWVYFSVLIGTIKPDVARIDEVTYKSLQEAINAVEDNVETAIYLIGPETITLDDSDSIVIPEKKKIILDLSDPNNAEDPVGNPISGYTSDSTTKPVIINNGTLTIKSSKESGGISTGYYYEIDEDDEYHYIQTNSKNTAIKNNGSLTILSGYIYNNSTSLESSIVSNNGELTFDAENNSYYGNIDNYGNVIFNDNNGGYLEINQYKNSKLSINNGVFNSVYIRQKEESTISIKNGKFDYINSYIDSGDDLFNKHFIEGGLFKIGYIDNDLIVEGKTIVLNTDSKTKDEYPYTIGDDTVDVDADVLVYSGGVRTKEYSDATKQAVADALSWSGADLVAEGLLIKNNPNIINDNLVNQARKDLGLDEDAEITIAIVTYLDIEVKDVSKGLISVDMTPKYEIFASGENSSKTMLEGNLNVTRNIEVYIVLPDDYGDEGDKVWIKHNGKVLAEQSELYKCNYWENEVDDKVINGKGFTFITNGFSPFVFSTSELYDDVTPTPTPAPAYVPPKTGIE